MTRVLVVRQCAAEERSVPAAHVEHLLRSWGPGPAHLTGLALTGVPVASRAGPRLVDALVFTPSGLVVIAAHGPAGEAEPGPARRAAAGVAAVKNALAAHDGGQYVTGLVAVVPSAIGPGWSEPVALERAAEPESNGAVPGRALEPHRDHTSAVPGVAVVLADPRGLRRIIGQHNRWRTVWSADDVLDACYALSLAHLAPARAALLADGFPARLPARSPLPAPPVVLAIPAAPVPDTRDDPGPRPPRRPGSVVFPRPRPIRLVPWRLVFVLTLLVAFGVVAAVFVAQVFHGT